MGREFIGIFYLISVLEGSGLCGTREDDPRVDVKYGVGAITNN